MFGKLMDGINDDYLRYVFHVQVLTEPAAEPDLAQASYVAADDPVQGDGAITAAFAAATPAELEQAAADGRAVRAGTGPSRGDQPRGRRRRDPGPHREVGRGRRSGATSPCWCGSGKKFKFCHGAN